MGISANGKKTSSALKRDVFKILTNPGGWTSLDNLAEAQLEWRSESDAELAKKAPRIRKLVGYMCDTALASNISDICSYVRLVLWQAHSDARNQQPPKWLVKMVTGVALTSDATIRGEKNAKNKKHKQQDSNAHRQQKRPSSSGDKSPKKRRKDFVAVEQLTPHLQEQVRGGSLSRIRAVTVMAEDKKFDELGDTVPAKYRELVAKGDQGDSNGMTRQTALICMAEDKITAT